jgi:glycine/D-amino acid oxidase-like deaminating enzyme
MNTKPYWFDSLKRNLFPPLNRSLSVDVLVVGGGVTGLVTCYLLRKAGISVALLDRGRLASRDSGHTTAHLTCVTDKRLYTLAKDFGRDHAKAAWEAGTFAIDEIERIVQQEIIGCDFSRVPGYLHASAVGGGRDERPHLKKDAKLATDFGFTATYLDRVPFMNTPGVRFSDQAKFHPLKFLSALATKARGVNAHIFENSTVTRFDSKKKRARANGCWVNYGRVVLATNNPLLGESGLIGGALFQTKLALYSSYVIGIQTIRTKYLRVDRDGQSDRAIFGGEDHKTGQARNTETRFRRIEQALLRIAPEAKLDHRWSGQVIETSDRLPYIGPNEKDQFHRNRLWWEWVYLWSNGSHHGERLDCGR